MRKVFLLLGFLFLVTSAQTQTPVVIAHSASATGSVKLSVSVGNLILVSYVPDPQTNGTCKDGANDVFTFLGETQPLDGAGILTFWARSMTTNSALVISCSPLVSSSQIYAAAINQAGIPSVTPFSGMSGNAAGTILSNSGDLIIAMVESGGVINASGWKAISTLNANLLASQTAVGPDTASFSVSGAWNLMLIDIPSAVLLPSITLTVSGSAVYDDGTAILPGPLNISQQTSPNVFVQCGTISSDAAGNLSGSLTVNPNLVDSNGNIVFMFNLPLNLPLMTYPVPVGEFQHGSTGLTINLTLFKQGPLAIKSQTLAVTP